MDLQITFPWKTTPFLQSSFTEHHIFFQLNRLLRPETLTSSLRTASIASPEVAWLTRDHPPGIEVPHRPSALLQSISAISIKPPSTCARVGGNNSKRPQSQNVKCMNLPTIDVNFSHRGPWGIGLHGALAKIQTWRNYADTRSTFIAPSSASRIVPNNAISGVTPGQTADSAKSPMSTWLHRHARQPQSHDRGLVDNGSVDNNVSIIRLIRLRHR